jgi:hypothetical protein
MGLLNLQTITIVKKIDKSYDFNQTLNYQS